MIASSGIPFNITTGNDPYQDSQYNVRPVFAASCATAAYATSIGCFNAGIPGTLGYVPIPVNYGTGTDRFSLNLRLSKTFGFGPKIRKCSRRRRRPDGRWHVWPRSCGGGGGGGAAKQADPADGVRGRRIAVMVSTFGVNARNIFNNVNVATPIGNLGSPLFGEANGLAGRPYSDSTSNRRLDLQLTFTF